MKWFFLSVIFFFLFCALLLSARAHALLAGKRVWYQAHAAHCRRFFMLYWAFRIVQHNDHACVIIKLCDRCRHKASLDLLLRSSMVYACMILPMELCAACRRARLLFVLLLLCVCVYVMRSTVAVLLQNRHTPNCTVVRLSRGGCCCSRLCCLSNWNFFSFRHNSPKEARNAELIDKTGRHLPLFVASTYLECNCGAQDTEPVINHKFCEDANHQRSNFDSLSQPAVIRMPTLFACTWFRSVSFVCLVFESTCTRKWLCVGAWQFEKKNTANSNVQCTTNCQW